SAARPAAGRRRAEDIDLDLVDVVLHGVGDRDVAVDGLVGDGVQHHGGPFDQQFRVVLQRVAEAPQGPVAAVPDGDDEVPAGEARDLAGLHDLAGGGEFGVLHVVD